MKIKLIIGLGNPGEDCQNTYHNVGFLALDFLTSSGVNAWQKEKNFWFLTQDKVIFVKPRTFMNLSGLAARQALAKFKVAPENTLVIHDDSDLNLGQSKLSFGRGGAGHKGVQSIIDALKTSASTEGRSSSGGKGGSPPDARLPVGQGRAGASGGKNFWRLRIGIRPPADTRGLNTRMGADGIGVNPRSNRRKSARPKAEKFVLKKIKPSHLKTIYGVVGEVITKIIEKEKP